MRTLPTIAIVAAAVAGAFFLGRASKRCGMDVATLDVKQRQEGKQAEASAWRMEGEIQSNTDAKANTTVVIHRKYLPPAAGCATGALDSEDVQIGKQTEVTGVTVSANHADGSSSKLVTLTSESSLHAEAPPYRWSLHALGGIDWNGDKVIGGQFLRRWWGPVDIGAQATNRGVMLVVGVSFK